MPDEQLTWMPAWQMRDLMAKRELSAREVTEHFLARIEELNPTLKAFEHVDAEGAYSQAEALDAQAAAGEGLGSLHGSRPRSRATSGSRVPLRSAQSRSRPELLRPRPFR